MFEHLSPILYVTLSPTLLTIKNLRSAYTVADIPEMAISPLPKPTIIAVGTQARSAAALQVCEVFNPFAHPRSLVSDFTLAQMLVKHQVCRVIKNTFFSFAPIIIMHPLGTPEGGFTQVELRAFREMACGAGAAKVYLKQGNILTDAEISQIIKNGPRAVLND